VIITSRYEYYEPSGEISWQVAPQTRAFRRFNEDWVVWVCGEARVVLSADFLFNGCQLEVSTDGSVRHVPGCVDDYSDTII
jgi:rubredoxin